MSVQRREKINDLLRDEIGQILHRELDLEAETLVTVIRAIVSEDLLHVRVYLSVIPSPAAEEVLKEINRQIYHLQQILNKRLRMRPIPKIYFVLDRTEEEAARIEKIAEEVKNK